MTIEVSAREPFVESASVSIRRGRHARSPAPRQSRYVWLVFWSTFVVSVTCAFARQRVLFRVPLYASGDSAINSLLVIRAEHFEQLVGNYSRAGFHHPGPALLYMLAGGEVLFRDVLHVVPTPYNGQLLAVSLYCSVFVSLAMVSLYRSTRSLSVTAIGFGLVFLFAARQVTTGGGSGLFGNDWFPVLYISAFLLFIVAGAGLAAGRTAELPLYVLAGATLINGHVSFIMFVGATTIAIAIAWYLFHRGSTWTTLRTNKAALFWSGGLIGVFALPMILELVFDYPGPWPSYWHYVQHASVAPRTVGEVVRYVWRYWSYLHLPVAIYFVAAAVAIFCTVVERDRELRAFFLCVYGIVLLESLLVFYYLLRGVDLLTPVTTYSYVGYFYETVPLLFLIAAAAQLWLRTGRLLTDLWPSRPNGARTALVAAITFALVAVGATTPRLGVVANPEAQVVPVANALRDNPGRDFRPVALSENTLPAWPAVATIALELQRTGVPWCIWPTSAEDVVLYTSAYLCGGRSRPLWLIHVTITRPPPNVRILWHGALSTDPGTFVYTAQTR